MSRWTPVVLCDQLAAPRERGEHSSEAMAGYLNGWLELWHPQLLTQWAALPTMAPAADHLEPKPGQFFIRLEDWPLGLVEDWNQRATRAGSRVVTLAADREEARQTLAQEFSLTLDEPDASFFGLGLGYWVLDQLAQAMGHGNPLDQAAFAERILAAAQGTDPAANLQAAADLLRAARDVLYPSTVHLLEIAWLDDWPKDAPLPWPLRLQTPATFALSGDGAEDWHTRRPEQLAILRTALEEQRGDLAGGVQREVADGLMPLESQFANLRHGWRTYRRLVGVEPAVFTRCRYGATPPWPELAGSVGIRHAVLHPAGDAEVPTFKGSVLDWPNPAGKTMLTLVRSGEPVGTPATWFYLPRRLHETIMQDYAALLLHEGEGEESTWHRDWLALHKLAAVFGQPVTLSTYFSETYANEHPPTMPADRFHAGASTCEAAAYRHRIEQDSIAAIAGLARGLSKPATVAFDAEALARLDRRSDEVVPDSAVANDRHHFASILAQRLLARATDATPGHLIFNTCGFTRRVLVDLPGVTTPLPAPAHATQLAKGTATASVELPPFGFAWLPLAVAAGTKIQQPKVALAEKHRLRNEHLEAELDPATGMLSELRDLKRRIGRLAMALHCEAASRTVLHSCELTSSGPAVGRIEVQGELHGSAGERLAAFKIGYELGWGMPYLKITGAVSGLANSEGLAFRFSWRDPAAVLHRVVGWSKAEVKRALFESPGFLEVATPTSRTQILTGGLCHWQRHGSRAADLLLRVGPQAGASFEIALTLEPAEPQLAVQDWLTPAVVVPVEKGPPPGGPIGWLFDLDSSHLMVTSLHPAWDGADAVLLRLVECRGLSGEAQLRCPRHPVKAEVIDDRGEHVAPLTTVDDTVFLHLAGHEAMRVRLTFSS